MAYEITDKCIGCGSCAAACPMQCISKRSDTEKYQIDATKCISCGTCASTCPVDAPIPAQDK